MLKHPFLDIPYEPVLGWLLGGIEIYDREETKGEELWKFDPNKKEDREFIIRNYIATDFEDYSYRHKFVLLNKLREALDTNLDFADQFGSDYEDFTSIAWEAEEIDTPRGFFEDIYRILSEVWSEELKKAAQEDQSTW